jgi:uncharacterized heparinase superfamily protein
MRPVFCVTEHLHRDLAVADDVVAGRFTCAGETRELGVEPRWLADLPGDEEWRIEWVKFPYGLDLAHAHSVTGDGRYVQAWERLVRSWLEQVPPESDPSEVTARRILNWIYARQAFGSLSNGLDRDLVASLADQARHVRATLTPERNHRTLELYALAIVALALADDDLLRFAAAELDRNLATDFRPDGVHREASTHYHMIALRSFAGLRENARRYGVPLPEGFDERLSRAFDFALHCRRPDGTIPALSDADPGDYSALLALGGDLLDRDDLRAGRGSSYAASFPDGGYFVQRSGWSSGDRYLIFDCGPLGDGGHGHYDALSFEAWAGGGPLVVDPGRFTYAEGRPNLRRWFRSTAAHNTVTVDRLDQTPYSRTSPRGPVADARFFGRTATPGLDVLAGEVVSPVHEAVHRRRVSFVDQRYWMIEDELAGQVEHRYELWLHLAPPALGRTRVDGTAVRFPGGLLVISGADEVTVEPGWVSERYGVREPAPVVRALAVGRDASFRTAVVPL